MGAFVTVGAGVGLGVGVGGTGAAVMPLPQPTRQSVTIPAAKAVKNDSVYFLEYFKEAVNDIADPTTGLGMQPITAVVADRHPVAFY